MNANNLGNMQITRRSALSGAAAAGLLSLCGCGVVQQAVTAAARTPLFDLALERCWLVGQSGDTMLVADYKVTYNGEGVLSTSLPGSLYMKATQGGKTLSTGYLYDEVEGYIEGETISQGDTGEGQAVFELLSEDEAVTLTCTVETTDYEDTADILDETVDVTGLELVESESGFDFALSSARVTDDGEGTALIVLEYSFTNNEDDAQSAGSALEITLFQNGVELSNGYLPYNHPYYDDDKDDALYTEVKGGVSIDVQQTWELRDTESDVEVEVVDWMSYDQRVVFSKTLEIASADDEGAAEADDSSETAEA